MFVIVTQQAAVHLGNDCLVNLRSTKKSATTNSETIVRLKKNLVTQQARLLLWDSPTPFGSFLVPGSSGFPGAWSRSLLSVLFVGFAPNLLIPEFIENSAQQQLVLFASSSAVNIEFTTVQDTLSITERLLHLANRASFTCKKDFFWWGYGPDALACKARPSWTVWDFSERVIVIVIVIDKRSWSRIRKKSMEYP